ncbi:concanavalin A-like lectin/glucanase domain-containing protein [Crucibulum laeve]|uniref:Concanavalin A-like lectin/glucanase domain-containing protein n=1 Tax=Crucibulum laeve TaxID=68775 RepID=A0A5C3LP32_9AGAR|nr:concanavalin A-like lectin/glucanase domain-containing protein [Crucibulum laeve]
MQHLISLPISLLVVFLEIALLECPLVHASPSIFDSTTNTNTLPKPILDTFYENERKVESSWFFGALKSNRPEKRSNLNTDRNGSTFLWLPQDEYSGKTFFDQWDYFSDTDPTHGHVNYVNKSTAESKGLVSVTDDGKVIMKADHTTSLPKGVFRDSVRISSQKLYTTGLFILDLNTAPWGCAVWPAFWTVNRDWPWGGEIDIIEGVHDNEHNQVAWHTSGGCTLDYNAEYSGTLTTSDGRNHTDCDSRFDHTGCGITEWSRASFGPYFDAQGGGVFVMKWDEESIAVWSFYRAAIPKDITQGTPNPGSWGKPSAVLESSQCDISQHFNYHTIVFDITFCGDLGTGSYELAGCPGTCEERIMDPANFVNATWSINSLKVYQKQLVLGTVVGNTSNSVRAAVASWWIGGLMLYIAFMMWA